MASWSLELKNVDYHLTTKLQDLKWVYIISKEIHINFYKGKWKIKYLSRFDENWSTASQVKHQKLVVNVSVVAGVLQYNKLADVPVVAGGVLCIIGY